MKRVILTPFLILGFSLQAMQQPKDLIDAAKAGNLEAVRSFLENGADVNQVDENDATALHWAAANGHLAITQLLIERGTSINHADTDSFIPLHYAVANDRNAITQLLLERGASVDHTNDIGDTPLRHAARYGHPRIIQILLDHSAPINQADLKNKTALTLAARWKHQPCCELLVNHMMKIPSDTQRTKIYTFLGCMNRLELPWVICNHMNPFLKAIIEQENREKSDGSVALREINKIKDKTMKATLIEKLWPSKP
eukprot:Pompholyxophrys_sp_v1_NODE_27_length_3750_cov_2.904465.p4 type:complete len:255 gc:universal NODE_27_length_3750_cov_2.904465:1872-2636(+)